MKGRLLQEYFADFSSGMARLAVLGLVFPAVAWAGLALYRPAPAFAAPQQALTADPRGTYRISGKVVDAHSGAALGHASVQIADVKERSQAETVTSAEDGSFAFSGLPVGKYSLTAQRRGYLAQSFEEHDQFSTAIAVGPGLQSEELLFKLTAEAILTGTVIDEGGEAVRGAQVRLFEDADTNGIRTTQPRHTAVTDDRGVYEIDGLRPGAYFLVATSHPWYSQHLQRAFSIDGGAPSGDVQALDVAYPPTFYPGVTEQDAATPIPIKGGDRLEANVTLAAQPAMRVRLRLPPGGENGRGVSVMLSQSIFGQTENLPSQILRNQGDEVEIDGVLPGHYDVSVNRFGPGEGTPGARHFEADVASGSAELTSESAVGEIQITGKVISPSAQPKPSGGISLRVPHGRRQQYGSLSDTGEFTLSAPPGTYEVVGNMNGLYIASVRAIGATLAGRMLTLKAGDTPKLEIVAGSGQAEIEGLALRNGKPASAVMVLLAPEDAKNNQILFRRDQSDSDGSFDIANVIPGRYRLLAIENGWELEWANATVLQAFLANSVAVEVRPGDHLRKQTVNVQTR